MDLEKAYAIADKMPFDTADAIMLIARGIMEGYQLGLFEKAGDSLLESMQEPGQKEAMREAFASAGNGKKVEFKDFSKDPKAIEKVAMAMVNADLPQFGGCWPWPCGDNDWEVRAREDALELAEVALRAAYRWIVEQK